MTNDRETEEARWARRDALRAEAVASGSPAPVRFAPPQRRWGAVVATVILMIVLTAAAAAAWIRLH